MNLIKVVHILKVDKHMITAKESEERNGNKRIINKFNTIYRWSFCIYCRHQHTFHGPTSYKQCNGPCPEHCSPHRWNSTSPLHAARRNYRARYCSSPRSV